MIQKLKEELVEKDRAIKEEEKAYVQYAAELDGMTLEIRRKQLAMSTLTKVVEDKLRSQLLKKKFESYVTKQGERKRNENERRNQSVVQKKPKKTLLPSLKLGNFKRKKRSIPIPVEPNPSLTESTHKDMISPSITQQTLAVMSK